ncbi:MAG: hypothetical protein HeimAB125_05950 [Candidatus Heimdallarchaeota archaeon AB_125]|nr:MAG: hypothetical protein HeimAB125_05950 [Candidatus Heimdallarchaeota archaeon AB_125]
MATSSEISLAVKNIKRVLTDDEIIEAATSCKGLRTIKTKENESREKYIANFKDNYDVYVRTINAIEEVTEELHKSFSITKTKVRELAILGLRTKQEELGVTKYLLNPVKYSFMKTIVNWIDNPSALKIKSVYVPRTKEQKEGKENSKKKQTDSDVQADVKERPKPKPKPKPKLKILEESLDIDLKIIEKKKVNSSWKLSFRIENRTDFPLQNLEIKIYDENDDTVRVKSVSGDLIETANGVIFIRFIPASMTNDYYKAKFVCTVSDVASIQDGVTFSVKHDCPAHSKVITAIFDL